MINSLHFIDIHKIKEGTSLLPLDSSLLPRSVRISVDRSKTETLEFSLNVFAEFAEFSDKKLKIKNEDCEVGTQDLLCKRQR